jgi:hypothetical protein
MDAQQYVPFSVLLAKALAANNIEEFGVAMEMQQYIPFALLSSKDIFHNG